MRKAYPNQWVVIEALEAHSTPDNRRHFDSIAVIETCADGSSAMKTYRELHKRYPLREFYFIHTNHEKLDIQEHYRLGIRIK